MAESVFKLNKGDGKEYPASFREQEFTFYTPDAPTNAEDWDGLMRAIRETSDDALTGFSHYASAYNLDRQKEIKDLAGEENATPDSVRAKAADPAFRLTHRRLRGMAGATRKGGARKLSADTERRVQTQTLQAILDDPTTPDIVRQTIQARLDALQALGVQNAPAAAAEQPTKGNKKGK